MQLQKKLLSLAKAHHAGRGRGVAEHGEALQHGHPLLQLGVAALHARVLLLEEGHHLLVPPQVLVHLQVSRPLNRSRGRMMLHGWLGAPFFCFWNATTYFLLLWALLCLQLSWAAAYGMHAPHFLCCMHMTSSH